MTFKQNSVPKIIFTFLIFFFGFSFSYAESSNCEGKDGYSLYLCRVNTTCDKYSQYGQLRVFNTEKTERTYQEGQNLYIAKGIYRDNMNSIYKCAILKSQNNAYSIIENKLQQTNAGSSSFTQRVAGQRERLKDRISALDCLETEKDSFNLKKDVLDEGTLEMCKYLHFLDYVKETHVANLGKLLKDEEISKEVEEIYEQNPDAGKTAYENLTNQEEYIYKKDSYTIGDVISLEQKARQELADEVRHTKKVYEVAFQTYANYESNMVIHLLFDMLQNDFLQVRNRIYSALSPINQVSYKIINAMSK